MTPRGALFLDRDGTINVDTNYLAKPEHVTLVEGAARAIARVNAAGVPVVVVTNQSGIGRGLLTEADFEAVNRRVGELLAAQGAHIDATYHCPHAPSVACECRKPGTLLFRRAAEELGLDLARSWYVGDRLRDIQPATALGGHGVLVPRTTTPDADVIVAGDKFVVATTLDAAVTRALAHLAAPLTGGPPGR
jgi:D-glycero-D-manno-heptose 1,7-bisphosphate phosphatase